MLFKTRRPQPDWTLPNHLFRALEDSHDKVIKVAIEAKNFIFHACLGGEIESVVERIKTGDGLKVC